MFVTYSYEATKVSDLNPVYYAPELVQRNPYLRDSLLLGEGGRRTISKVTPSFVHNTVDNPIFPNSGTRLTGSIDFAGLGGNTNFLKPRFEYAQFMPLNRRMSVGFRTQVEYIRPYAQHDRRCRSPRRCISAANTPFAASTSARSARAILETGLVLGGNKTHAVQRRVPDQHRRPGAPGAVLRHRPGARHRAAVRAEGRHHRDGRPERCRLILDPFTTTRLVDPNAPPTFQRVIGETSAFKTSTGAEIRFFMPVLNVPFRLIFAYNPQRFGVLDNNLRPAKRFTFKFAVGSTF